MGIFSNLTDYSGGVRGVPKSTELTRILNIPRRVLDPSTVDDCTFVFALPWSKMKLWPLQSAALVEACQANGLFAPLGVGAGKTLITLCLYEALSSTRQVILLPPQLKKQLFNKLLPEYRKHFKMPDVFANAGDKPGIYVIGYSELSSVKKADILDRIKPDLVVCDEAHSLRHKDSARTKRFLRFMRENPGTRFCALSGTITTRSIKDYQHLIDLALRKHSPVPSGHSELQDWSNAIDVVSDKAMQPGALMEFCNEEETQQALLNPKAAVRSGFRRRLVSTLGVVASTEDALGSSLVIRRLDLPMPQIVLDVIEGTNKTWSIDYNEYEQTRPVESKDDALSLNRSLRQLASGFFLRWNWKDQQKDVEWLTARKAWHQEMRGYLATQSRAGLDSPLLLARAAAEAYALEQESERLEAHALEAGELNSAELALYLKELEEKKVIPEGAREDCVRPGAGVRMLKRLAKNALKKIRWRAESWAAWAAVKHRTLPPVDTIWIDLFQVHDAIAWANGSDKPSIIWVEHPALGEKIAEMSGIPYYGAGRDATFAEEPVIVCSIKAQGTGKNLQRYCRNLITTMPANGTTFEQLVGRTHRPGQTADEVEVDWYGHTEEMVSAFDNVLQDAKYQAATMGQAQKAIIADKIDC